MGAEHYPCGACCSIFEANIPVHFPRRPISLRPFPRIAFRGGTRILPGDHTDIARNGLDDPIDLVVVIRAEQKEFQFTRSLKRFEQDAALFFNEFSHSSGTSCGQRPWLHHLGKGSNVVSRHIGIPHNELFQQRENLTARIGRAVLAVET